MTEYGTIRIPRDEYEKHNQQRKQAGLTWVEYINGEAPSGLDVDALRETIGDATTDIIEPVPSGGADYEEVLREVGKAVELAEQARDNTDEIKRKLK